MTADRAMLNALSFCAVLASLVENPALALRSQEPTRIYVSLDGDDTNDGSASRASMPHAKGPVRTFGRAQALVQLARARRGGSVEVVFAPGTYEMDEPIRLGGSDSGTPAAPIIYRAAAGGTVTFSGGRALQGWHVNATGEMVWVLDLSAYGGRCPAQLYVNGERRARPRFPARGAFLVDHADQRPVETALQGAGSDHFFVRDGDLSPAFQASPGTEIIILDAWTASRLPLAGYDPITRRLDLGSKFQGHKSLGKLSPGLPYYIENAPVARLDPGQWQCDSSTEEIRYRPLPMESGKKLVVIAPRLTELAELQGTVGARIHDIRFEGIGFVYSSWTMPTAGWAAMQAEAGLPAAIEAAHCDGLVFERIRVEHTGASGLRIGVDCKDITVSHSFLNDLGGGGVMIGSDDRNILTMSDTSRAAPYTTSRIRIEGNVLHGLGRIQHAAVGIWQGQADHVVIEDNHISDLFYSGISIGWVWNSTLSVSRDNKVIHNVISDYGQGLLSDFGGIYTLGNQPDTLVANNYITGGRASFYGGWGLYADAGSSGITFKHNTIRLTSHAALHAHEVGSVVFADNVASKTGENGIICSKPNSSTQVQFIANQIEIRDKKVLYRICAPPHYIFK